MKRTTDIDIDFYDRDQILRLVTHVPATMISDNTSKKHTSGAYFTNIPTDPITAMSAIDYKTAEQRGYFKIDFLNNSVYAGIRDEQHLTNLMSQEPLWELLTEREIVDQLVHIHSHYDIVARLKPTSVMQLAAVIAIIRPAKRYLATRTWEQIMKEVWVRPTDDTYFFKKSHSVSYAMSIVVQLNLICEQAVLNAV